MSGVIIRDEDTGTHARTSSLRIPLSRSSSTTSSLQSNALALSRSTTLENLTKVSNTKKIQHHSRYLIERLRIREQYKKFDSLDFRTVHNKNYKKQLYDNFGNVKGNRDLYRWIITFVVGMGIGFVAWLLHLCVEHTNEGKFSAAQTVMNSTRVGGYFVYLVINVGLVVLGSVVSVYAAPAAAGGGIPEVKAFMNGVRIPAFLSIRTFIGKFVATYCAVGGGLQVGAEAPMIHIGACVANGVSQGHSEQANKKLPPAKFFDNFRNDQEKRDFIASGAAAGVAAAFSAPIGGTLFSQEDLASYWDGSLTWRTFFCCFIACITVRALGSVEHRTLKDYGFVSFPLGASASYSIPEFFPFIVLGVFGGLLGAFFTWFNIKVVLWRRRVINKKAYVRVLECLLISVVASTLQYTLPFAFGCRDKTKDDEDDEKLIQHHCAEGQYNELASLFFTSNDLAIKNLFSTQAAHRFGPVAVLILFICYYLLAAYTAGAGISAGALVPSLVIGSAYGRLVGYIMSLIFSTSSSTDNNSPSTNTTTDGFMGSLMNTHFGIYRTFASPDLNTTSTSINIDPGVYALVGAASFMAGLTRMSASVTVIILEMSNDLRYLLPIMIAILVAKALADRLTHPIYDQMLDVKYFPFLHPHPSNEMKLLLAKHVMNKEVKYFLETELVRNIINVLSNTTYNGFPILNNHKEKVFKGLILRSQLAVLLKYIKEGSLPTTYNHASYMAELNWRIPQINDIYFTEDELDSEIDLTPWYSVTTFTVTDVFPVAEAFSLFRNMGLRHLPVVNERNRIKGMITRKDLCEDYCEIKHQELHFLKQLEFDIDADENEGNDERRDDDNPDIVVVGDETIEMTDENIGNAN